MPTPIGSTPAGLPSTPPDTSTPPADTVSPADQQAFEQALADADQATPEPAATPQADAEGLSAFVEGVVAGEFSDNASWSTTAGQIVGGLNPLADVRDIGAGLTHVVQGKDGAWWELGLSVAGTIPIAGDAAKAIFKGGAKVGDEITEAGAERVAKEAAEKAAKEAAYKTQAQALEAADGGHSLARHGPEVPDAALEARVTTGIAPDGRVSPTKSSTRFNSYENWILTREAALREIEKQNGVDLSKPWQPGMGKEVYSIDVRFDRPIDDGYAGVGQNTKIKIKDSASGKMKTIGIHSVTADISNITGTRTTVAWNATANKWQVVQHFPIGVGWDDTAKAYNKDIRFDAESGLEKTHE